MIVHQLLRTSIWSESQIVVNPCGPLKNQTDIYILKKKGMENYKPFV